jgi:iron complex transport system substrate-binding protein
VRYWYGDEPYSVFPWAQDELGDAEPVVLGEGGELDFEAVAALDPDLIVGLYSGMTEEEYNTLSQIAPTVPQSGEYIDYGMPWQEVTVLVGRALGREAEAEALVQEVEGQFESARSAHPEWEGLNAVIGAPDGAGQFGFVASQDPRSRVLQALGFVVPEEFDEIAGDQFYGSISLERADLLDQDLIVFFQLDWVEGGREAIESDPLLSRLDAVQEGRAVYLAGELDSALAFNSVLSLPHFLEAFIPMLEAAMDGDPETDSSA